VFDSHCHLDFPELASDLEGHLARALAQGVSGWFVPGCHVAQWATLSELIGRRSEISVGVGQHPYWSTEVTDVPALIEQAHRAAKELGAVAIGECGLDKGRGADLPLQMEVFEGHLALAQDLSLPVVVHQVGCQQELLRCLSRVGMPPAGGVVHGFSGNVSWGRALVARGFHLGVGSQVVRPLRQKLRAAVSALPLERLLLETDAPDQSPEKRPGVPSDLVLVRDTVAALLGVSEDEVGRRTALSARELFRLPLPSGS
jgi:TatD DNase family protein